MNNAAEAIFIHDTKGKILDVNLQACKNLQYTREELLSKSIKDISVTAEDEKHVGEIWSKVLAGNTVNLEMPKYVRQEQISNRSALSTIFLDKEN
jgi:PAS domain S-box-containing protein